MICYYIQYIKFWTIYKIDMKFNMNKLYNTICERIIEDICIKTK